jgi:hypothetical protein
VSQHVGFLKKNLKEYAFYCSNSNNLYLITQLAATAASGTANFFLKTKSPMTAQHRDNFSPMTLTP